MLAAVLFVVIASPGSRSQGIGGTAKSSAGTEFWIAFPGNFTGANQIFLYVVATGPASVTVDFAPAALGVPFSQTFPLAAAGQVHQVILPSLPGFTPGMSRELLKLSGSLVHDYATISDDSPSPNRASRARRAATSAGIS